MTKPAGWFEVDKEGLAQILERRGKNFAVLELLSNAWDQNVTTVDVLLTESARGKCVLTVTDDDPDGFADLTDAFTLFAPSRKKGNAELRGRFNLGEKLVLALCDEATIRSTKGAVTFGKNGRTMSTTPPSRLDFGSQFSATIRMTPAEVAETIRVVRSTIPPVNVITTINDEVIPVREPVRMFRAVLPTEIADDEGNLRPTQRKTTISVFEPLADEVPMIYEMGIPVVENGDRWHYDISQKVPLNMDRDNVRPAYLRALRTLVLNETYNLIDTEDANATWTKEAIEDERVSEEAVRTVIEQKFGKKAVIFDPSDPEANNIAVAQGYTLIHGRSLSSDAWANIRKFETVQPAGQVTPSPSALLNERFSPDGKDITVPEEKWTDNQRAVVEYAKLLGDALLGFYPVVQIVSDITLPAGAWYSGKTLTFNVGKLGHRFFDGRDQEQIDALLIHEFAHRRVSNHLSEDFHKECCRLGAKLRTVEVTL